MRQLALITLLWLLQPLHSAYAYYSTMDTGEILERYNYKLGLESQFVTSGDDGVNMVARFDSWLSQDSNVRALLGFGTTDFQIGGFYKWVPIPDVEGQPAIGLLAGLNYARVDDLNDISLRLHPLISKKLEIDVGEITPYASVPFGLRSLDGHTDVPIQFVLGTEFKSLSLEKVRFMSEVGFNVQHAFTYLSLAATIHFDEEKGLEFR